MVSGSNADLQLRLKLRDEASKGLKAFGGNIEGVTGQLKKMLPVLGVAGVAGGFAKMLKATADAGDEVQKMAIRTGFSTESLSELRFAAELSGTSINGMETGFRRMAQTIIDADRGIAEARRGFESLGLSIKNIQGLGPEKQFLTIAEALADVEDQTLKVALATDFFGRSGTQLLPLLDSGSKGLRDMRKQARDLGIVFNQETAEAAAEFNDNLVRMKSVAQGFAIQVANPIIGGLNRIAESFRGIEKLEDLGFQDRLDELQRLASTPNIERDPLALLGFTKDDVGEARDELARFEASLQSLIRQGDLSRGATFADVIALGVDRAAKSMEELAARAADTDSLLQDFGEFGPFLTEFQLQLGRVSFELRNTTAGMSEFGGEVLDGGRAAKALSIDTRTLTEDLANLGDATLGQFSTIEILRPSLIDLRRETETYANLVKFAGIPSAENYAKGLTDDATAFLVLQAAMIDNEAAIVKWGNTAVSVADKVVAAFNRQVELFDRLNAAVNRGVSFAPGIASGRQRGRTLPGDPSQTVFDPRFSNDPSVQDPVSGQPIQEGFNIGAGGDQPVIILDPNGLEVTMGQIISDQRGLG